MVDLALEENKTIIYRYFDQVINQGKLAVVDELVAPGFIEHKPTPGQSPGREGLKQLIPLFHAAFPDAQTGIEDIIAEGDKVAVRSVTRATHTGPMMGLEPTGRRVEYSGVDIFRIANGQIVEHWWERDHLTMMRQLGLIA
jgi:predicted ester cyclase